MQQLFSREVRRSETITVSEIAALVLGNFNSIRFFMLIKFSCCLIEHDDLSHCKTEKNFLPSSTASLGKINI